MYERSFMRRANRYTATIWRKSVRENGYKCNICGTPLSVSNGLKPDNVLLVESEFKALGKDPDQICPCYCPKCDATVAYIKEIETEEELNGFSGDFDKFTKRRKLS